MTVPEVCSMLIGAAFLLPISSCWPLEGCGGNLAASCELGATLGDALSLLQREANSRREHPKKSSNLLVDPVPIYVGPPIVGHEDEGSADEEDPEDEKFGPSGGTTLVSECIAPPAAEPQVQVCNCMRRHEPGSGLYHTLRYKRWAMWRPSPESTVLSAIATPTSYRQEKPRQEYMFGQFRNFLPLGAYNPAMVRLPERVAASLHPDAYYIAAVRHSDAACMRAGLDSWDNDPESTLIVMDRHLQTLLATTAPAELQDFRLFATPDGKVLLAGNYRDDRDGMETAWSWRVFEISMSSDAGSEGALQTCPSMFTVVMKPFEFAGIGDGTAVGTPHWRGKNLGLFSDGYDLKIVWRLSNPVDVRSWSNRTVQDTDSSSRDLRNNGNPLYLPELNAYLAVGHIFWTESVDDRRKNYMHRFVLFNATQPYNWIRASQPLCLPAISPTGHLYPDEQTQWCEGIQFIMSWLRDGADILVSYGINDCEAAMARIPLQTILDTTSENLEWTLPEDMSVPKKERVGSWSLMNDGERSDNPLGHGKRHVLKQGEHGDH